MHLSTSVFEVNFIGPVYPLYRYLYFMERAGEAFTLAARCRDSRMMLDAVIFQRTAALYYQLARSLRLRMSDALISDDELAMLISSDTSSS